MTNIIKHQGTVEHIEGTHVQVRIIQTSACSSCSAKSLCHSSESKEKLIDIYDADAASFVIGQEVTIYGTTSMGMRAVGLAFGIPFLILIAVLVLCYKMTLGNELVSALVALMSLIPYYIFVYAIRNHIKKTFAFKIKQ